MEQARVPRSVKGFFNIQQYLSDNHNACFQQYTQNLSPTASTDYSLWKAVRKSKHITQPPPPLQTAQGAWACTNIDKAQTSAKHLASVFQPNPSNNSPEEEEPMIPLLESPYQLEPPQSEIQTVINNLFPKTSPG
jgi:hypothetical protein